MDGSPALDDAAARERVARVEALLAAVEESPAGVPRDDAIELVSALLDLYGEGLRRIVGVIAARDDGSAAAALSDDELVSHLLLLHGLHPVALEDRVRGALDEVRPYLESHGGGVELLGTEDGVVRLALQGSCDGCASSAATMALAIEDAIHKAAPDVAGIEADGATPAPAPLLQIELSDALRGPVREPQWTAAGALSDLADGGGAVVRDVAGRPLLFLRADGETYAYAPHCPACGVSLDGARLDGEALGCGCGARFDVRRAGRRLDADGLQLEPVPLLVDAGGTARVAV